MSTSDRRRSPRVAVTDHQHLPAALRDVSLGGFSLELPEALGIGTVHDFELRVGPQSRIVLRGRVAHIEPESRGPRTVWVTGLQFLADLTREPATDLRRTA